MGTTELLVPNNRVKKSKCFVWCRLGTKMPFFLSLSCTEVVPNFDRQNLVDTRRTTLLKRNGLGSTSRTAPASQRQRTWRRQPWGQQRAPYRGVRGGSSAGFVSLLWHPAAMPSRANDEWVRNCLRELDSDIFASSLRGQIQNAPRSTPVKIPAQCIRSQDHPAHFHRE